MMRELPEKVQIEGIIAHVAVDKTTYSFDQLFSYLVPPFLEEKISAGMRVMVPFGKGNRKHLGMVFLIEHVLYEPQRIKKILHIVDREPALNAEQLKIASWLHDNTFCTYFDAVKSILPSGLGMLITKYYSFKAPSEPLKLSPAEQAAVEQLSAMKGEQQISRYITEIEMTDQAVVNNLIKIGLVERQEQARQRVGAETKRMVRLAETDDPEQKLTPKQKAVIDLLTECQSASIKEICYNCNVTPAVVANLVKKRYLEEYQNEVSRSTLKDIKAEKSLSDIHFSPEQQTVFDGLQELMNSGEASCALLRGITGSGKTSVFIKLIEYALTLGKTAMLLVPEIALTPQMTSNFTALFGGNVAIIHSGLSLGQRNDEYKRIERGEAKIVIGTRSAVFAPLEKIGIIVIDEEGEHTYKSERAPRYHARDVAKQRAVFHKALLLLASATPSLESYHFAKNGRYKLFELNKRYSTAVLPDVYLVDMKVEAELGNRGNFSEVLVNELALNLQKGEQSMILLNRRGYHTYASCIKCGTVLECPNCAVALTYHKPNDSVQCHYCGYSTAMQDKCKMCGSQYIRQSGTGTQRIEEELKSFFPKAKILRMDADTTMTKDAYEKSFKSFGEGDYDIMVGTQMIAKGLDFENVTLVGVLLIDKALYAGDYLGYERTFSLVTQVVGRSGRGSKKGRAYLQTYSPDHYVLELAAAQNYTEFYEQEIDVRKALIFPPFCDIFLFGFSSVSEKDSMTAAKRFIELFAAEVGDCKIPFRVLGPTKNVVGKINGKYRHKVIVKSKNNAAFREVVSRTLKAVGKDAAFKNISYFVDINGEIL